MKNGRGGFGFHACWRHKASDGLLNGTTAETRDRGRAGVTKGLSEDCMYPVINSSLSITCTHHMLSVTCHWLKTSLEWRVKMKHVPPKGHTKMETSFSEWNMPKL